MKPFNLEQAKAGKPIVCRDGTPARFVAHVPEADALHRVVVLIDGTIETQSDAGRFFDDVDCEYDLFMAAEKREGWLNVYADKSARYVTSVFPCREKAEAVRDATNYITTVRIEWEE